MTDVPYKPVAPMRIPTMIDTPLTPRAHNLTVTADGKRTAQFEHTMVVTEDGAMQVEMMGAVRYVAGTVTTESYDKLVLSPGSTGVTGGTVTS